MALCDQLEQQTESSLDAHNLLVDTLLSTLTDARDAKELSDNWARLADHFDTLITSDYAVEQLKQTILQLAVMGKLVLQDPNDEPASELLKRIAAEKAQLIKDKKIKKQQVQPVIANEEKPFTLPVGWKYCRLREVIQITSGNGLTAANMAKNGEIPVFGGNGITGYHDVGNVDKETLVIGRVGYYCGSIHITPPEAWVTDNAFITTFSESNIFIQYLYWLLKGTDLKENESATAQPVISGRKIYPIVIALPPTKEQFRIVAKLDELMTLCDQLKAQLSDAQTTQLHLSDAVVENALTA